ncbi:MAG: family 20 glycosylhydrolase [Phycisphaerae bacterium]|nr:family 20 glycosylhydrolase [Phycisphaerae bacterium]
MNGFHLDLKRSMPSREYVEHVVKTVRSFGIDTILLEFEDKILIDWLTPEVHPDHWTANDVQWFLQLAKRNHITVIPMIPMMGHMEWILQWPRWAHLRENHDPREICPLHPETPAFLRRFLQTALDLFPDAPLIHIGGDETRALGSCSRCKATKKSKSKIYLDHFLPLIRQVESAGRRATVYGDIFLAHPEILPHLPRSAVICDWDYRSATGLGQTVWGYRNITKPKQLDTLPPRLRRFRRYFLDRNGTFVPFPYAAFLKDQGFDVILLSAARCIGDNYCVPQTLRHIQNTTAAARRARELNLMGTIVTDWAVRYDHVETTLPAAAASAWTYQDPQLTTEELAERFAEEYFGCRWPTIIHDLNLLAPILPDIQANDQNTSPGGIVRPYIRAMYSDPNGWPCKDVSSTLAKVKQSYQRGLKRLRKQAPKIQRNQDAFALWMLAAETLVHKAAAVPTIMKLAQGKRVPPAAKQKRIGEIRQLCRKHKKLFGKTFLPVSVETEIRLRFTESLELLQA